MIELYESRSPSTGELVNGPYPLLDAIDCIVTEERNGLFNLTMTYPIRAKYSDMLIPDAIVMATPRPSANPEPFRISTIEQVIEGVLTVRANHIAYDLDGTGVFQYLLNGKTFSTVVSRLNTWISTSGPTGLAGFEFVNDGITDTVTTMVVEDLHISFFQAIGMVASQFNAELKYVWDAANNKCTVYFCAARGTTRQTIINYGINITSLDRTLSASELYSDVRTYWTNDDGSTVVYSSYPTGYTKRKRILWLNVTEQFPNQPNQTQLFNAAKSYVQSHDFSLSSELNVEFVPLENTTERDVRIGLIGESIVGVNKDPLYLCDTVAVDASLIGVTAGAKVVAVEYNVITEKYDRVTIGTLQDTIVDTILGGETIKHDGLTEGRFTLITANEAQVGSLDVVNRRSYATLSSAGWYRVLKTVDAPGEVFRFEICRLSTSSNNETHTIDYHMDYGGKNYFLNETSVSGNLYIDKIRCTYDNNNAYIDIHYNTSTSGSVYVHCSAEGVLDVNANTVSINLESVADAPSGETIMKSYDFVQNATSGIITTEISITTDATGYYNVSAYPRDKYMILNVLPLLKSDYYAMPTGSSSSTGQWIRVHKANGTAAASESMTIRLAMIHIQ